VQTEYQPQISAVGKGARPCRITAETGRGTVTISAPAGSAISMATSEVSLHGLTLRNADAQRATLDVGVGTLSAEHCDIVAAGAAGVFVRDSATLNLSDSRVEIRVAWACCSPTARAA
jgi:hypothetical protein